MCLMPFGAPDLQDLSITKAPLTPMIQHDFLKADYEEAREEEADGENMGINTEQLRQTKQCHNKVFTKHQFLFYSLILLSFYT